MIFKAAVLEKKKKLKILELSLPKLREGQLLVKIMFTSICHTQIQEILGLRGKDKFLPHCLGHEATGIVVKVGPGVKKIKKNDKVCLTWIKSNGLEGKTIKYLNGQSNLVNAGPVNTFSNYSIVSENRAIKLPKISNLKKDVLMGCAIPTAFNAVFNTLKNNNRKNILIIGSGGLGLASIFAAKKMGFKKIYALDKNKAKLQIAKKFGASNTIYLDSLNNFDEIMKKYKNFFSCAIECSGNITLMEKGVEIVKNFGGNFVIIGNYQKGKKISLDPWNLIMGKKISGSWQNEFNYEKYFQIFYNSFKYFKYRNIFGKKIYKIDEINLAVKDFINGKVIRPLIKM